jgi:hypothetical protein
VLVFNPVKLLATIVDLWAYLKGLTLPKDLRRRGTLGGPQKKKKKIVDFFQRRKKVSYFLT